MSITKLLELEEKATPGPWGTEKCNCGYERCTDHWLTHARSEGRLTTDDAALIVEMRNSLPELARGLRELVSGWEEWRDHLKGGVGGEVSRNDLIRINEVEDHIRDLRALLEGE